MYTTVATGTTAEIHDDSPWALPNELVDGDREATVTDMARSIASKMIERMPEYDRPYTYGEAKDIVEDIMDRLGAPPRGDKMRTSCVRTTMSFLQFFRLGRKSAGLHDMEG